MASSPETPKIISESALKWSGHNAPLWWLYVHPEKQLRMWIVSPKFQSWSSDEEKRALGKWVLKVSDTRQGERKSELYSAETSEGLLPYLFAARLEYGI